MNSVPAQEIVGEIDFSVLSGVALIGRQPFDPTPQSKILGDASANSVTIKNTWPVDTETAYVGMLHSKRYLQAEYQRVGIPYRTAYCRGTAETPITYYLQAQAE